MNTKKQPLISIVITTKNEEKNIANCLESIKKQTYPQEYIEIIVVDNNSIDKTKDIVKKDIDKVYNYPDKLESKNIKNYRGAQLNFGVNIARGEIIFFPDADMTFDEGLIGEALRIIENRHVEALYIPEIVIGRGIFGKIRNFERSFYNETCIDAVRIIKKNLFLDVGGFDEKNISFGFDDWDFNKKIKKNKGKFGLTLSKIYHHEETMTLERYLEKKRKYSERSDIYIKKWGRSDPDIQKQFGFWYRYLGVFLEKGKWRKLLHDPFLTIGIYFFRFLVGFNYLVGKTNEKS